MQILPSGARNRREPDVILPLQPVTTIVIDRGKPRTGITDALAGETIEAAARTDEYLILRCASGKQVKIGWRDLQRGRPVLGIPVIETVDRWK